MTEEHRLTVFENRVLRNIFGQRGNRKHYIKRSFIISIPLPSALKLGLGGGAWRFIQGYCLSPILFDAYSNYLANESLEGFEDFKIGQVIRTVKCADDLLLLAKEEAVLQGMIEGLIAIGGPCGVEMNVERN
jgi:hypothetical protein